MKQNNDVPSVIKIKDYQLNYLKVLLQSIPREILYVPDGKMQSCENKWQALTLKNKIIEIIRETNSEFENGVLKDVEGILNKFSEERQVTLAEFDSVKDVGTEKEKKEKALERAKFEVDWANRQGNAIKEAGLRAFVFNIGQKQLLFIKQIDDSKAKYVDLVLNGNFKQIVFIQEQLENFYKLPISDDILGEIVEYFLKR